MTFSPQVPPDDTMPAGAVPQAVVHTNLALLEVADPHVLTALRADRHLGPLLLTQLSDCVAVVRADMAESLVRALRRAGYTPRMAHL